MNGSSKFNRRIVNITSIWGTTGCTVSKFGSTAHGDAEIFTLVWTTSFHGPWSVGTNISGFEIF